MPVGRVELQPLTEGNLALKPIAIQASSEDYDPARESLTVDPEATNPSTDAPLTEAAQFQSAAIEALFATKKNNSAAEQLEESTWTIANGEVRIETTLSKPMLATIFRPDVEAIIKTTLREKGLTGIKLVFIPATLDIKPKEPKKPRTGSVQAKALDHPTVQAAQKLFNAEVTSVLDLRKD